MIHSFNDLRELNKLLSEEYVLDYLEKNTACDTTLNKLRAKYERIIGYDPTAHCPIRNDIYRGATLIPVQEGLLYLPYQFVEYDDGNLYDVEGAYIMEWKDCKKLLHEFTSYAAYVITLLSDTLVTADEEESDEDQ